MLEAKGPICLFDRGLKEERWEFREVLNIGQRNLQICLCYYMVVYIIQGACGV